MVTGAGSPNLHAVVIQLGEAEDVLRVLAKLRVTVLSSILSGDR